MIGVRILKRKTIFSFIFSVEFVWTSFSEDLPKPFDLTSQMVEQRSLRGRRCADSRYREGPEEKQ